MLESHWQENKIQILFICHGNICRSPMAEYVLKDMAREMGIEHRLHIESAATSAEELGNPIYPPVLQKLAEHGIICGKHAARRLRKADYDEFDMLIGMDEANVRSICRICGQNEKVSMLLDYTDRPGDVADPWYTGDFEATWRDVERGCRGLLNSLL